MEELARRAQQLLDKPNAADQQTLNSEIDATIQAGEQARTAFQEIAAALDGEAAKVRNLVLKEGTATEIDGQMIALAQTFAGKKAQLDGALQTIALKAP